ncbi:MAG: TetR-like C-terminal domain-containing protein [Microthrixaceae bacterium]
MDADPRKRCIQCQHVVVPSLRLLFDHHPYHHGDLRRAAGGRPFARRGRGARSPGAPADRTGGGRQPRRPIPSLRRPQRTARRAGRRRLRGTGGAFRRGRGRRGPDGALERGGLAYIGFGLENPALFRLMFDAQDTAVAERLEPAARAAYEVFASSLRAGPGATREELAATAWSVVHGYTLLMVNGHLPDPVEPRVVVERAMSGLASMTGARGARG